MLRSEKLRLLFAHVPKSAGSAVTAALLPWLKCPPHPLPVDTHGWQMGWYFQGRMHHPWIREEQWAGPLLDQGWRLAAICRNPWHRMASLYRRVGHGQPVDDFFFGHNGTIHHQHRHHIQTALDVAGPRVTDWLPYDCLETAWGALCRDLGIRAPLVPTNYTPDQRGPREVLTGRVIEWVWAHFHRDITAFGYSGP